MTNAGIDLLTILAYTVEAALAGALVLWVLRKLQLRQHAYEDAPQSHQAKSGTPTMGGLVFLVPLVTIFLTNRAHDAAFDALFFLIVACSAIGFADDYMSIARGRNLGLRGRTKFLATALIAVMFVRWISDSTVLFPRDTIAIVAGHNVVVAHWFWLVLGIVAITGTIHAVNLTDGLDGLATGAILPPLLVFFVFLSALSGSAAPSIVLAIAGGCLGFLWYNRHPAKMFMGDTGSLALGAALAGAAILAGQMLLLVVIGGLFVAEALSVIVQVAYFKRTKKRIFRMSPLHHHFELGGWSETKVTARFWTVSALLSLIGLAIAR